MRTEEAFQEQRNYEQGLPEIFHQQPTKASIQTLVTKIVEQVDIGNTNPAELAVMINYAEQVFDELKKQIRENVIGEIPKEGLTKFGAKIEAIESGIKYDYSNCGDSVWQFYDQQEQSAKASKKDREQLLKALKGTTTIASDLTGGELVTVRPPIKYSTSTYKITLPKE